MIFSHLSVENSMNILTQLDTHQQNNTPSTQQKMYCQNNTTGRPPMLHWQNTNVWTCTCGVAYDTPYSGSLRHLCKKCGEDVSRRLLLSKYMKIVNVETSFYSHNQTYHIESTDVLSWAELNWLIVSGGLSTVYLSSVQGVE